MNLYHGGFRGLAVAAATEVAGTSSGDHAIAVAVISASSGLLAVILTQLLTGRRRRDIDHVAEASSEHADLSERLLAQLEALNERLAERDAEFVTLRKELDRERRSHE